MKLEKINIEPKGLEEEDYHDFLADYLMAEPAVRQSRALKKNVRYIVFQDDSTIYALEERGDWTPGVHDLRPENDYRKVYRNGTCLVKEEKVEWEEARELLVDHSNFSS